VIQRGNNRCVIFRAPSDYRFFLATLQRASAQHQVSVHGYVLMTTHLHLVVTPASASSLPRMMQTVGRSYVRFYNTRYERTGALWEGRYRAAILHDEKYWISCLRYVELNPVRAGLSKTPDAYPWSSYRVHAFGREDPVVSPHPLYLAMGEAEADRQTAWRAICGASLPETELTEIRRAIHAGRALGEPLFHEVA